MLSENKGKKPSDPNSVSEKLFYICLGKSPERVSLTIIGKI